MWVDKSKQTKVVAAHFPTENRHRHDVTATPLIISVDDVAVTSRSLYSVNNITLLYVLNVNKIISLQFYRYFWIYTFVHLYWLLRLLQSRNRIQKLRSDERHGMSRQRQRSLSFENYEQRKIDWSTHATELSTFLLNPYLQQKERKSIYLLSNLYTRL